MILYYYTRISFIIHSIFPFRHRHVDAQNGQHRVSGGGVDQNRRQPTVIVVKFGVQKHFDHVQTRRGIRRGDTGRPQSQVAHRPGRQQVGAHPKDRQSRHHDC